MCDVEESSKRANSNAELRFWGVTEETSKWKNCKESSVSRETRLLRRIEQLEKESTHTRMNAKEMTNDSRDSWVLTGFRPVLQAPTDRTDSGGEEAQIVMSQWVLDLPFPMSADCMCNPLYSQFSVSN